MDGKQQDLVIEEGKFLYFYNRNGDMDGTQQDQVTISKESPQYQRGGHLLTVSSHGSYEQLPL